VQPTRSARHISMLLVAVVALGALLRIAPIWFGLPFDRARPGGRDVMWLRAMIEAT
jgi:hypothetical protein